MSGIMSSHHGSIKYVQLKDEWEKFTIRFSVFSSSVSEDFANKLRIIGNIPELTKAGSVESGPISLKKAKKKFRWLYDKYGQEQSPWELTVKLNISRLEHCQEIIYSFSKAHDNDFVYEREPSRILEI